MNKKETINLCGNVILAGGLFMIGKKAIHKSVDIVYEKIIVPMVLGIVKEAQ